MSAEPQSAEGKKAAKGGGRKKLLLIALPVLLLGGVAGLWFTGILPGLLGMGAPSAEPSAQEGQQAEAPAPPPAFFDMPEIVANLNVPGRRQVFVKLRSKLEVSRGDDVAAVQAAMPRLLDLFQTYLRETRPEELRGSIGTHRLREELIARANVAVAPPAGSSQRTPRITDVLFTEILIQ